jgi:hypothetical protein
MDKKSIYNEALEGSYEKEPAERANIKIVIREVETDKKVLRRAPSTH